MLQKHLIALFALLATLFAGVYTQELSEECSYNIFPLFVGGDLGSEKTSCLVYDPINDLIMLGGNTTSEDFAPASNEHGYLIAIDTSGNWVWGNFFYNVSWAISDIKGCTLSSDGKSLTVMALGNAMPVMMSINPSDGAINTFIDLTWKDLTDDNTPTYDIGGAVFNDVKDSKDDQNYFYTSFNMNDEMHVMRILNKGEEPKIDWHYSIVDITTAQQADDQIRRKDSNFMHPDPKDDMVLYLTGRLRGFGSVIRFQKRDMTIRWWAQFNQLTKIYAVAYGLTDDNLFICGDYQPNEADPTTPDQAPYTSVKYTAGIARMSNDGEVNWFITMAGENPEQDANLLIRDQDRCRGLTYNEEKSELGVVLQIKMYQLRGDDKANFYDNLLVILDTYGGVKNAVTISQGSLKYDMEIGGNSMFRKGDDFYWGGWANGYQTNYHKVETDSTNAKSDSFVFRYQFDRDYYPCLLRHEPSASDVENRMVRYSGRTVENEDIISVRTRESNMFKKIYQKDFYTPQTSKYSGGFALADTFKIPRPCAYKSANLTAVDYYRGQKSLTYDIFRENDANTLTLMNNAKMTYQTGKSADDIASLDFTKNTIMIQTDAEDKVAVQQLLIRDCDQLNRLLEMNLYINVKTNNHPDFVSTPQTTWTMAVDDVVAYQLPSAVDPEGNDEPEVYVRTMDAQEDKYPPFLMFENATNTLIFKPASKWVSGRQYYFTIVIKERNSDSVKYSYYCTVRVTGEIYEQDTKVEKIWINYEISDIDEEGKGGIVFDNDVNMTWLEEKFGKIFNIYWQDTNVRDNKENKKLKDFQVTSWGGEDNRTINFWLEFDEPYKIGLLRKRSDKLWVDIIDGHGEDITEMFVTNKTITSLNTTSASKRLEMIFDWRNPEMALLRKIAKNMYWVLVAIILLQFALLSMRRVGLLPVWVFIEYLQLVGFMPVYNFRLIPYLYDAFKPTLVSHMIIFDNTPGMPQLDQEYFNSNYKYYWLSVGRMSQSFFFCVLFLFFIVIANLVVYAIHKANVSNPSLREWARAKMVQFKFNAYIRFYMLAYFDTTFFSLMKIMDENNSTTARKAALLLSYIIFIMAILLPIFLIAHINRRFEILGLKQAKQSFNTLLLKIDKASRWRVMNPAYFFARRLLTALLLTLPINNTFIFLQYVFILMSSHAYILYMVACKPYQTPSINSYVLANETFYSALIIAIFIFSDATPELPIKFGAGVALMVSLVLLVLSNIVMNIVYLVQGPNTIKKQIKEATLKRAEKEALERAEEEERKLKKKKEEEEFTKIPDDTMNITQQDPSNMTGAGPDAPPKGKGGKKKKKGQEDNVVEPNGMGSDDFNVASKKRRRGKDKEKGKGDDVTEGTIGAGPSKSKRRKTNQDTVQGTDFTTNAHTKGDLI